MLVNKKSESTRSATSVPQGCRLILTEFSVGTGSSEGAECPQTVCRGLLPRLRLNTRARLRNHPLPPAALAPLRHRSDSRSQLHKKILCLRGPAGPKPRPRLDGVVGEPSLPRSWAVRGTCQHRLTQSREHRRREKSGAGAPGVGRTRSPRWVVQSNLRLLNRNQQEISGLRNSLRYRAPEPRSQLTCWK